MKVLTNRSSINALFFGVSILLFSSLSHAVEVKRIDLFIQHGMVIQNQQFTRDIQYQVHYVDAVKELEGKVNKMLPSDPVQAKLALKKMIDDARFGVAFGKAYQTPLLAKKYGITAIPAALINRQGVVYGSTDIAEIKTLAENRAE